MAKYIGFIEVEDNGRVTLGDSEESSIEESDAKAFWTWREIEGPAYNYVAQQFDNHSTNKGMSHRIKTT